jgi:tetratricopeptide (TPR) repeat protein
MFKRAVEADPNHANNLGNYAVFLQNIRRDYDAAEAMFKRAVEADPNHANHLGNYAVFLQNIRRDYDAAEAMFKRAVEADPDHANTLGNYAQMLLARGDSINGYEYLGRAVAALGTEARLDLHAELAFCEFAHGADPAARRVALEKLKELVLAKGARSPGWDLSRNVERAVHDGHPEAAWLAKLASVIADEAGPDSLNDWPAWVEA